MFHSVSYTHLDVYKRQAFFLIAFVVALMRLVFLGDTQVFPGIINSTFNSSKTAFEISLGLTGVLSLWLGIMRIGGQMETHGLRALKRKWWMESINISSISVVIL